MSADVVTLMNEIQEIYLSRPFFGYRRITAMLGYDVNRKCVSRLVGLTGFIPEKEFIQEEKRG
jgi:hypothetical protein